jgi:hypothetical protein
MNLFVATSLAHAEHPTLLRKAESCLRLPMVPVGRLIN